LAGDDQSSWPRILSSVGFQQVFQNAAPNILILEGDSPEAAAYGFRSTARKMRVASVEDLRNSNLSIVWERAVELPVFEIPPEARVFTREKSTGAPLVAGLRRGETAVLWTALPPGEHGYERFPYLLQALADLDAEPGLVSRRLWAFFDSSYRLRVDLDYFARQWREAGIAALHVAAWHFYDPDPSGDAYLRQLIEACHRHGILVYAWLELPHVSDSFWNAHPEWREKTALLQDAQLDWRKLMNLANRDCFNAASQGIDGLIGRFSWDGVNLAELYFESLEGSANPARFTPMNDDVRREFREKHGFDPLGLFQPGQVADLPHWREFLDYRATLASRIEAEWMNRIEAARRQKPDLDLVLTHVDDRLDARMRDAIGVDSRRFDLARDFTLLIEDPATVWHLGPDRYADIARRYQPAAKLAIDINVVERYQDVYPTKQQTGVELFELVHVASQAFPRVALYFENSILGPDLHLLPASAAVVNRIERAGQKLTVDSPRGVGIHWHGPARVDGQLWPVTNGEVLWLPPGVHEIAPEREAPPVRLLDFNGELKTARSLPNAIEFTYESSARALALVDREGLKVEIDGLPAVQQPSGTRQTGFLLTLPRGPHRVELRPK
jgi:hypothetical protein